MNGNTYTSGLDYQSQQNQQQGGFAPHNQQSHQQGGFGPQNQQNQSRQPMERGFIKIVRKYVEKKHQGQTVMNNGRPETKPLYRVIGEVTRWPASNSSGYFDKIEWYPGTTIGETMLEGCIDWQSQNQNQQGR